MDTEDGQILDRIGGEGKPLLLLHEAPRSSDEFRALMPILAQNRRVIAMGLMGYGDSDKPPRMYSNCRLRENCYQREFDEDNELKTLIK